VLGGISLATGIGEVAGATLAIGDLTIGAEGLGAISFGTGLVGLGADGGGCIKGDPAACIGAGLSLPGAIVGAAGLLPEGLLPDGLADILGSEGADYFGLGTGAIGYLWDLYNEFYGDHGAEGCPS
jgi:hypothetical protein